MDQQLHLHTDLMTSRLVLVLLNIFPKLPRSTLHMDVHCVLNKQTAFATCLVNAKLWIESFSISLSEFSRHEVTRLGQGRLLLLSPFIIITFFFLVPSFSSFLYLYLSPKSSYFGFQSNLKKDVICAEN